MKTVVQSPHIKLGTRIQRVVQKKFDRLEKLFDRIESCSILLKTERNGKQENFIVEAKLAVPGNDLFARDHAESFEIAAEKVSLELESQLKKHKAKLNKKATLPIDHFLGDADAEQ